MAEPQYNTVSDYLVRYPVWSSWSSSAMLYQEIQYTQAELNSLLSPVYTIPFSDTPMTITDLNIELMHYRLVRSRDAEKAEEIKDSILGRIQGLVDGASYVYTGSGTTIPPKSSLYTSANSAYYTTQEFADTLDPV